MNAARSLSTPDRTPRILQDLEAVRENRLALSDDVCQTALSTVASRCII